MTIVFLADLVSSARSCARLRPRTNIRSSVFLVPTGAWKTKEPRPRIFKGQDRIRVRQPYITHRRRTCSNKYRRIGGRLKRRPELNSRVTGSMTGNEAIRTCQGQSRLETRETLLNRPLDNLKVDKRRKDNLSRRASRRLVLS